MLHARRSGRAWFALAVAVVVLGTLTAYIGAAWVARSHAERDRQRFTAAAAEVANRIEVVIGHEDDLIIGASALVARTPSISNVAFVRWANDVHALERFPELQALGIVVPVTPEALPAYKARVAADPTGPTPYQAPEHVSAEYCVLTANVLRTGASNLPPGYDFCQGVAGEGMRASRDSGIGSYIPFEVGDKITLAVQIPVYRDNVVPATVAERRAAFIGWVGVSLEPTKVLESAVRKSEAGFTVKLERKGISVKAGITSGPVPAEHASVSLDLRNSWIATVYGPPIRARVWNDATALWVLLGATFVTLLLAAFVSVLASGRARAEKLVRLRTEELRFLALHDSLTGLANRALVADRAEQLMSRSRRANTNPVALYLDLDGFKGVNDTCGHEGGDDLLRQVASRLTGAVRQADTIARMGGDEFLLLLDGAVAKPELVSERVLETLRQPFSIGSRGTTVNISASIGVSTGDRASSAELIQDADVAMYEAKAAGKNSYAVFHPAMQFADGGQTMVGLCDEITRTAT